jgi:hypothetical protein
MKAYLFPLIIFLVGCDGPYKDLEQKYPKENEVSAKVLTPESLVLTSQHHKGAFSFRDMNNIQLTDTAVYINLDSFFHKPLELPISNITGCSCTYFNKDNWDTDLILGDDGIEIGIHLSKETKDWCFKNNLPVITGKQQRDWLYNKKPLPSFENYVQVSREDFDYQFKQACMGY